MADVDDIVRLTHDYALYNDTFQVDALVDLFVEDAFFDMTAAGLERYDGRTAIRDFFEREKRALSHLIHFTSNHRVDVDGDRAEGTAYFHAIGLTRRDGIENAARVCAPAVRRGGPSSRCRSADARIRPIEIGRGASLRHRGRCW